MKNVDSDYEEWCKRIAKSRETKELINHFREHVHEHFDRYDREEDISLKTWLVGTLNFMHILEKKFPEITKSDLLFKLCAYNKDHGLGPDAPFDIDKFLKKYKGDIKKVHRSKHKSTSKKP